MTNFAHPNSAEAQKRVRENAKAGLVAQLDRATAF